MKVIFFAAEFTDYELTRFCLSDSPTEVNAFLATSGPLVNKPPRHGVVCVLWTHHDYTYARKVFDAIRDAHANMTGNLVGQWSSPQ